MRDPRIAKAAAAAAAHYNGKDGFPNNGRLNRYTCIGRTKREGKFDPKKGFEREPGCGQSIVTVDREPGVTPFMTACPFCGGDAQSGFYRVPPDIKPDFEWYRPDTFDDLKPHTIEHILNGGLIMREIVPLKGEMSGE